MDDDVLNLQIRKFLKNVGITSQREIETAVRMAIDEGRLKGTETIKATITLNVAALGINKIIEGEIGLE